MWLETISKVHFSLIQVFGSTPQPDRATFSSYFQISIPNMDDKNLQILIPKICSITKSYTL